MRRAKRKLLPVLLVSFCLYQCMCVEIDCSLDCKTDKDCSEGNFCCEDERCHECCDDSQCTDDLICCYPYYFGTCHECCVDSDCPFPAICRFDECQFNCPILGDSCPPGDYFFCCPDLVCDLLTGTCVNPCFSDEECQARPMRYAADLQCIQSLCDFQHCQTADDCPAEKICDRGNCVTIAYSDITRCQLTPSSTVTLDGGTVALRAGAYYSDDEVVPSAQFEWSSGDESIATVDADGLVTGGAAPGSAVITAKVTGAEVTCEATVVNYSAATGTRVLVFDEFTGMPIEGASVKLAYLPHESTNANGESHFQIDVSPAEPADVTVSHPGYTYTTLRGVESPDLVVHLQPVLTSENTASFLGEFDVSKTYCMPDTYCSVAIGIAGMSMPGNLMNMDFTRAGILPIIRLGHGLDDAAYHDEYQQCHGSCIPKYYGVTGFAGERIVYGLAGRVGESDLIDRLGLSMAGNDADIHRGELLTDMQTIYQSLHLAVIPDAIIEGEFNHHNMQPATRADQVATIVPPRLYLGVQDTVIVYAGAVVSGTGLVILGVGAGVDSKNIDDTPDEIIDNPIDVPVADITGHIPEAYVQRVLIALAVNTSDGEPPTAYSVQVLFVDRFEGTYVLREFMLPAVASNDRLARHLDITLVPPADCYQFTFRDIDNAGWHVFDTVGESFTLPAAPPEGDRNNKAGIYCLDLRDDVGYQDLPAFNNTNLGNLIELVRGFSYSEVR